MFTNSWVVRWILQLDCFCSVHADNFVSYFMLLGLNSSIVTHLLMYVYQVYFGELVTMMEIYMCCFLSIVFLNFFFMYGEIGRNYHIALLFEVFIRLCFFILKYTYLFFRLYFGYIY